MSRLILTFREVFADDDAVMRVDGGEPIRIQGVTSKLLTGVAAEVPIRVVAGRHRVTVELPGRHLQREIAFDLEAEAEVVLEVWCQAGELSLRLPGPAAGYL